VIPLFVLATFAIAPVAGWIVNRNPRAARFTAVWPALLASLLAAELWSLDGARGRIIELPWVPSLQLSLTFNLDGLGLLFALLISAIGALIALYASAYLQDHPDAGRFYASLLAFLGAMLGVALSDNILALFVFWELTGFTSFLLIGFEHDRADARAAALQALIVTGAGGLALLGAGVLLIDISGSASLSAMADARGAVTAHPLYVAAAALTLLAAFTKSAQVPFHFWLPNAMAAPTPVSAYLHSATMVKAGVYLLARMTPILGATSFWGTVVPAIGATTMVLGAYRSVQETDLKRILAYSTVSALGLMTMLIGVGTAAAITAMLVYLVGHAFYKGALFLVAGAIDHETGTRDITRLAGLRRTMPLTALAGGAAALSMAGVPLTLGFIAKDGAYEALLNAGPGTAWLLAAAVLASVLMGVAGLLAGVVPFRGQASNEHAHEPEWRLLLPPGILAVAGLLVGLAPWLLDRPLTSAASAVLNQAQPVSLAIWHGLSPALMLSAVTLLAIGGLYAMRDVVRRWAWRPAFSTEQIYAGLVSSLDAISRAIGPPLHSASLRSYVMVIVVVTVTAGTAALSTLPRLNPGIATDIRIHEVLVVVVIIAGAIGATMAKSTMAAVLSLGVVGYGVAVTFLMYGAPDLAMTQFSVETLTVLIYVLVFRHFRNLGELSPALVRYRDLLIGAATGALIGTLVLTVSTSHTAAQLREYFVEFGPTLGHGRNIVNVILVDFRAFDTLGEITVLTTAAIGVRALLRIAGTNQDAALPEASTTSPIFKTGARLLMPLLLMFALFLLWRGHNEPGGGFVGGLVAAAAFSLYVTAYGVDHARRALLVRPATLLGTGLLMALFSGIPAVLRGQPFLTAQWMVDPVHLGTPVLFDIGVFLVVTGVVLMMVFSLAEES
jgi:multicomponent Na+:H+ antiporter subunit A